MRILCLPGLLMAALLLGSCASGDGSAGSSGGFTAGPTQSLERDELGHRPGPRGFSTVILDAGHGGRDPGAVSPTTGQQEKVLALDTVRRIQAELGSEVEVVLMREGDTFVDLDDRAAAASTRDGAILVSVHYNAGNPGAQGPETYWWRVDSHSLARRCQAAMSSVSPVESGNLGMRRRRLRLTRNPDVPSVLLEIGYLSTPAEAARVADPAYRQQMAEAIAGAILAQRRNGDLVGPLPEAIDSPPSRPTDGPSFY